MSGPDAELLATARSWIDDDPDPTTAEELAEVLAAAESGDEQALADLADRFAGTLEFGTAGLRGRIGAGPNRMNVAVVIRAAAGLAAYLTRRGPTTGRPTGDVPTGELPPGDVPTADVPAGDGPTADGPIRVVVGYDARHRSYDFASATASVLTGAGIEALVLPGPLPTPVLAWAVRRLPADAGVMVTASHNPPADNGYKVYLGGPGEEGTLIVPPADTEIAACIDAVGSVRAVPRPDAGWGVLDEAFVEEYVAAAAAVAPPGARDLRVVLTPLHGVGGQVVESALRAAGFTDLYTVEEQARPDPDFPTVTFPNPEEAGAIDLALTAAAERQADLVVANDPDADRCAVAVRDPDGPEQTGGWRMLSGDELGAVFADHLAPRVTGTLACSIVSSTLLDKIAARHDRDSARTLTGFKWIARTPDIAFGYEEALGYCVAPDLVHDKDGVSAAVLACHLAAELKTAGRTMVDVLDELAQWHGLHATGQLSIRVSDLSVRQVALARLFDKPPATLGGRAVWDCLDMAEGPKGMPATEGVLLVTVDGDWVIVRPSGTEPKLKAYFETVLDVGEDGDVAATRAQAADLHAAIKADLAAALGLSQG